MNRDEMIKRATLAMYNGDQRLAERYAGDGRKVVDAILPQVTTVEELEALPGKSLLYGTASGSAEWVVWQPSWQDPQELLEMFGPLTVVWTP